MSAPFTLPFEGATPSAGLELEQEVVRALFAECRDCERVEAFPSSDGLPAGWLELPAREEGEWKAALCPDCRANLERDAAGKAPLTPALVHCGFRLSSTVHAAAGFATLRLRGGERGRDGAADTPATWLTDRAGIRALIDQLEAVDASLAQGEK